MDAPCPTLIAVQPTVDRLTLFANFGGSLNRVETLWLRDLIADLAVSVDVQAHHLAVQQRRIVGTATVTACLIIVSAFAL